jgi:hypothetical protein
MKDRPLLVQRDRAIGIDRQGKDDLARAAGATD